MVDGNTATRVLYSADLSITTAADDKFDRADFAVRLAETIMSLDSPAGVVVGLYGSWGEGKSSVLNLMSTALATNQQVKIVSYNPWRLGNEAQLVYGFFEEVARALDKDLKTRGEKIGDRLKKAAGYLSFLSRYVDLQKVGESLSSTHIEQFKQRVEGFLEANKQRVVVIMDDIDRLDADEVHTVFNLVKMSANFKYVTYVLAFDDAMVASALAKRYAGVEGGKAFLDKIIQIPLRLPKATSIQLRRFLFDQVDDVLHSLNLQCTSEERFQFRTQYVRALEPKMQTPRSINRYINALKFSLPLLKGEANLVDLMLLEGIRIAWPDCYEAIRNYRTFFLTYMRRKNEGYRKWAKQTLDELLSVNDTMLADEVRSLIAYLFPSLSFLQGHDQFDLATLAAEKRIGSEDYFDRYFSYHVRPTGLPKDDVDDLLALAHDGPYEDAEDLFQRLATPNKIADLIAFIGSAEQHLTSSGREVLVRIICRNANLFEGDLNVLRQLGTVVRTLVKGVDSEQKQALGAVIIDTSVPFYFTVLALGLEKNDSDPRVDETLCPLPVANALVAKLEDKHGRGGCFGQYPELNRGLILSWLRWGTIDNARDYLRFDSERLVMLIRCFLEQQELSSIKVSGYPRDQSFYDHVASVVPVDAMYHTLSSVYDLSKAGSPPATDDLDELAALGFAYVHIKRTGQRSS